MSGAVDLLVERTGNDRIGVVGYCMGGGLALVLATQRPDHVRAVAPYYGVIPWSTAQPDWSKLEAKVVGEYAELDEFFTPELARELEAKLRGLGKDATIHVHEGCRSRLLQRRPARGVLGRARAGGVGAHQRAVPRGIDAATDGVRASTLRRS